jgi:hypothetical protein
LYRNKKPPEEGSPIHGDTPLSAFPRPVKQTLLLHSQLFIRDGILTLPAAIAIRNPETAAIFCNPDQRKLEELAAAFQAALPEAEQFLDEIAAEACREATKNAPYPHGLLTLVDYTRGLSCR